MCYDRLGLFPTPVNSNFPHSSFWPWIECREIEVELVHSNLVAALKS